MGIKIMKKIIFFTLLMFNIVFSEYKTVILSTSPLVVKTYTDYADIKEIITSRIFLPKYNFISISNIIGSTYDDSRSIAIGKGLNIPLIGIEDNILLGFNSTSTFKSICIGNNAYSEYEAISIGHNARTIHGGLAIGNTFASYGIAINFSTTRSTGASRGISIGWGNFAQNAGISIGGYNRSEESSISIGVRNNTLYGSIALGIDSFATSGSKVLGSNSLAEGYYSFVIGNGSRATAENSGVIGNFTINNITNTIKIQDSVRLDVSSINVITLRVSTITFADGTILYSTSTLGGGGGGNSSGTTYWSLYPAVSDVNMNGYAINNVNSIKVNTDNILFGGGLLTNVYNGSIAIGIDVYNNYNNSIGIGYNANNNYNNGIGIGAFARGNYNNSVGIGYMAQYNYDYVVSIGAQAQNNKAYSVAIGYNTRDNGFYSTTIGAQSYSNNRSVSIGFNARSNGEDAISIGYNSTTHGRYGIAIGVGAIVNNGRGVAIGHNCVNNDYGTVKFAVYDNNDNQRIIDLGKSNNNNTTYIALTSANGTVYYLYVNDAGSLMITTSKP